MISLHGKEEKCPHLIMWVWKAVCVYILEWPYWCRPVQTGNVNLEIISVLRNLQGPVWWGLYLCLCMWLKRVNWKNVCPWSYADLQQTKYHRTCGITYPFCFYMFETHCCIDVSLQFTKRSPAEIGLIIWHMLVAKLLSKYALSEWCWPDPSFAS